MTCQKLKELGREQSRTRRRLQAFSRKIFPRRASKAKSGQKIPECRRARARCSNPNFEAEEESPSWRDFQNCAALQDSAAKTARVSCQARPLPQCHTRCASRGALATMQTPKHEAVKKTAAGNRECRGSRRLRLLERQDRRAKPR